jgi:hypothetical protein
MNIAYHSVCDPECRRPVLPHKLVERLAIPRARMLDQLALRLSRGSLINDILPLTQSYDEAPSVLYALTLPTCHPKRLHLRLSSTPNKSALY